MHPIEQFHPTPTEALTRTYIDIVRAAGGFPTLRDVEGRSGHRVHETFESLQALGIRALGGLLTEQTLRPPPVAGIPQVPRRTRIEWQIAVRSNAWEEVLPLWQVLVRAEGEWPEFARRVQDWRDSRMERLRTYYAPELANLPESLRWSVVFALDAITDYAVWGRLRQVDGLSTEEGRKAWIGTTERLLAARADVSWEGRRSDA
jgi:hypothetical protein